MTVGRSQRAVRSRPSTSALTLGTGVSATIPKWGSVRFRPSEARAQREPFATSRAGIWWRVLAVVVVGVYLASLLVTARASTGVTLRWNGWAGVVAGSLPMVPIAWRCRRSAQLGAAWVAFLLGVGCYNVATVLYLISGPSATRSSNFSASGVVYLVSYAALVVGVVLMTQRRYRRGLESARLDGAVAGLTMAALGTLFWFNEIRVVREVSQTAVVGRAYPLVDLVLLVVVVTSLAPSRYRPDARSALLMAAFTVFAIADALYLHELSTRTYHPGTLLDGAWVVALWLVGAAAGRGEDQTSDPRTRDVATTRAPAVVPILFSLLSVATLAIAAIRHSSKAASFFAVSALCVVVVRMALTLREIHNMERANFVAAHTDDLTGLPNRRSFIESIEQFLSAVDDSRECGVILVDLDGFKEVNDSLGHACGDELLCAVARLFARRQGVTTAVARLGGDEFAVLVPYDEFADVVDLVNQLANDICQPIEIDGVSIHVSASIGVATYPEHGRTQVELMRSADVAMYEAKRNRSSICLYHSESDAHSRDRLALVGELRRALSAHEFVLHYQVTRDFATGALHGAEALVRWHHPTRGLLLPDVFIPIAERVGLIGSLTRVVLRLALHEMTRLDANGHRLNISVNISRLDLEEARLPIDLAALLEEFTIDPQRLTLEITESSLGESPLRARVRISQLRALGVRISIDDFGVGHSSMSQLLELPVDELKIDKSFVVALATDVRASAVIHSAIELARALRVSVVAEGIENADSFRILRELGADVAQGHFIARPLTSEELDDVLTHPTERRFLISPET